MKTSLDQTLKNFRKTMQQAQDSLKVLESLEKEVVARAKTLSKLPKRFPLAADEKILSSLKALGLVTRAELATLEARLLSAENQIQTLMSAKAAKAAKTLKTPVASETASPETEAPTA
jgi:exonuclease VII small subunit